MKIDKTTLAKWEALYSTGDASKVIDQMSEDDKVTPVTIRRAFKDGECNDAVFHALATFYTNKEERIKAVLK
jgi:hypothetical protein